LFGLSFVPKRPLPILPGYSKRGWLDRTLNEQAVAGSALGCAGDFSAAPQQIELFVTDETLARARFKTGGGKLGHDSQPRKRALDPFVNAAVAFSGAE
jgi:hypothetical protein